MLFRTKSSTFMPGWWRTAKDNFICVAEMDTAFLVAVGNKPEKTENEPLPPSVHYGWPRSDLTFFRTKYNLTKSKGNERRRRVRQGRWL